MPGRRLIAEWLSAAVGQADKPCLVAANIMFWSMFTFLVIFVPFPDPQGTC